VARVAKASFVDDTQSLGTLRARRSVVVRPEASGRIQALKFTDGQRVRKGALLVQLDDTLQQAQLQQAEASASIARTNLQRSRELAAQNFVSQSAVDQNAAALEVAMAQVALAQAQVGRMRIMAPFDGITGIRSVNVGDYVKDGAELVVLEDLGALWVDFRLPERYLSRLREGQSVELSLDAMPGKTYQAKVVALDAQLDTNGRALLVRASLANEDGRLRGGMFARVRTVFSTRDQALVVPEEALVPVGDDQVVFKVVDGERGKIARRVSVRIGARLPGKVEIVDGLAEGDVVVVAGQARLVRGNNLPVRVVDLNRPASGGAAGAGGAGRPPGAAGAPRAQGEPGASGARGAPGVSGASGAGAPAGEGARSAGTGRPS
jgi:membrane fusion protein (multidrug efflux system)